MEGGPTRAKPRGLQEREKRETMEEGRGEKTEKERENEEEREREPPVPPIYIPANPPHQRRSSFLLK